MSSPRSLFLFFQFAVSNLVRVPLSDQEVWRSPEARQPSCCLKHSVHVLSEVILLLKEDARYCLILLLRSGTSLGPDSALSSSHFSLSGL